MPGLTEILIIAFIIILIFGAKKLPELAKGMGSSIKQFKKGMDEADEEKKEHRYKACCFKMLKCVKK